MEVPRRPSSGAARTQSLARKTGAVRAVGTALCLLSALGFSAMTIFGKLAYEAGLNVPTLLSLRFGLAASVLWLAVWAGSRRRPRMVGRLAFFGFALGAVLYAPQSGALFAALTRLDASIAVLLLYAYPSVVTLAGAALGRDFVDRRRAGALALATVGVGAVLASGQAGAVDALGASMALVAAVGYAAYILIGEGLLRQADPIWLAAVVCSGVATSCTIFRLVTGGLDVRQGEAWIWILCIALISTVMAVAALYAGMRRVGPTAASILSTIEPVAAVSLAFVVFGDRLSIWQLLGATGVVAALVLLQFGRAPRSHERTAAGELTSHGSRGRRGEADPPATGAPVDARRT